MISRARRLVPTTFLLVTATALLLGGCLDRRLKPLNPCLVSGVVAEIAVTNIDKVDLLFLVDSSGSMKEEQGALRTQFPNLIRVLTSGDRNNDGVNDFPPAKNLHLGVVTSDMGLVGIPDIDKCNGLGDDGLLQNTPSPEVTGCQPAYPAFLSYLAGVNDQAQTATDFACIASVGTDGCGFEQQLESMLKAVWPSIDKDPETGATIEPNRIEFLGDQNGAGKLGHGDVENVGFLRNDPVEGLSLIALIEVSDEEDCSSLDTRHFTPPQYLPADSPLATQDLNLRCFYNPQNLYMLDRYVNGFQALRPGNENLVIFAAITGVPPDLVEPDDIAFDFSNESDREAFYSRILNDPRMIETVDPNRPAGQANLIPSCNTDTGRAYPPRRVVEVARRFKENGIVQSICQADFGPSMDAIIAIIAKQLGAVCLPRSLVRNSDGLVPCNVVWELPVPNMAPTGTPTSCGAAGFPFLLPPDEGSSTTTDRGGAICKVAQLAVRGAIGSQNFEATDGFSDGWYYDNYSDAVQKECLGASKQRVAFTPNAKPPTGVTVKLECLNETQSLANNRTDINPSVEQPSIGDPCENATLNGRPVMGDAACVVLLADGKSDVSMFCHPKLKVCVLGCDTDADCAAGWVCDSRPETLASTATDQSANGRAFCVNPTCGDIGK